MAEEKRNEKEEKKSAETSAQVSSAQNDDADAEKKVKDSADEVVETNEIMFEETDENLGENPKKKKGSSKIDKKKIERIKKELFEDDEFALEQINKNLEEEQAETHEEITYRTKDGKLVNRTERIAKKNEQLIQDVYRYNRQKTKDIANRKRESVNVVLIVLLFLLLIAVLSLGIYLYLQKITAYDEDYIRVSVSMTNKDIFYDTEVTGELIPKSVSPGDTFKLNIIAKNSNSILGDTDEQDWTNIYVRFKIALIVDGVSYDNFIHVEPNAEVWERYNKEIEDGYPTSEADPSPVVKADDGYYYCRLILEPNQQVTVIDWLRFSEVYITELVGGNDAVLQVSIEALEAIPNIIKNREIWMNAPQHWILYMTDENNFPNTGENVSRPNNEVNVWWIILFVAIAILLTVLIVFFSTRKRKTKKLPDLSKTFNKRNE